MSFATSRFAESETSKCQRMKINVNAKSTCVQSISGWKHQRQFIMSTIVLFGITEAVNSVISDACVPENLTGYATQTAMSVDFT